MNQLYSLENALKFNWSSISGNLNSERISHLKNHLVGNKILDAGCGGGGYVEFLAQKGLEVTGIDKYDQFLQIARDKGRIGTYIQGDITNLPFSDKTFDCTYCFDVLEHIDDQLAIQELARVTKNRIIIAVPKEDELMHRFGLTFLHYQDKTHLRNYTEESLQNLVTKIDYSNLVIFPELSVPAKFLVREMIEHDSFNYSVKFIAKNILNRLSLKILNQAVYRQIHTGLVAIITL